MPSERERRRREEIGQRIIRAYRQAQLQQAELAEQVGVSSRWIRKLERGEAQPDAYLDRIAQATGVSAVWLRTGENPPRDAEIAELRRQVDQHALAIKQLREILERNRQRQNGDGGTHES